MKAEVDLCIYSKSFAVVVPDNYKLVGFFIIECGQEQRINSTYSHRCVQTPTQVCILYVAVTIIKSESQEKTLAMTALALSHNIAGSALSPSA